MQVYRWLGRISSVTSTQPYVLYLYHNVDKHSNLLLLHRNPLVSMARQKFRQLTQKAVEPVRITIPPHSFGVCYRHPSAFMDDPVA